MPFDGLNRNPLDDALRYAKEGFEVFPVKPGAKTPLTNDGFKSASSNPELISRMFSGRHANIGIATGRRSNLLVIDHDHHKANGDGSFELIVEAQPDIRETVTVRTGGGGTQYYLLMPEDPTLEIKNRVGLVEFVDVRADGGYVVAPGSYLVETDKHPGGTYQFSAGFGLDDRPLIKPSNDLIALLTAKSQTHRAVSTARPDNGFGNVGEGARNDTMFRTARSLVSRLNPDEAWPVLKHRNEIQCSPPLDEAELRRLFDSALSYSQGDGHPLTDAGNARRFAERYGNEVRFVPERDAWFVWTGTHWAEDDDGAVQRRIKEMFFNMAKAKERGHV